MTGRPDFGGLSEAEGTAYQALLGALGHDRPLCEADTRYIAEPRDLTRGDIEEMRETCVAACPLYAACKAFADASRPLGGFYAGRHYGKASK